MHEGSYMSPQIFGVDLDHEQAILTQCSLLAMNAKNGMLMSCKVNRCKNAGGGMMGTNSGLRLT